MLRDAADIDDDAEHKKAVRFALASQSDSRIRAMLNLAATEPGIVVAAEQLDRDPFLLACGNGTLDLRTGELRESDPGDLLTLGTDVDYDPAATCPRWIRFLAEIFNGDEGLIGYMRRLAGWNPRRVPGTPARR
jgi:putative DNA primase/helicase